MNIDPCILAFSAVTVVATIFMGFWTAKKSKTASDFFVAGRSVSVGWNASAISGEYLSAASFMGIAGMVMSSGYDALWYPVCYACGYLFLLLFIAGPLRRFGAYTIPDFAEGRFDSPLFRKIAVVFVLFIGFFYTMPQMKGAGTTLSYIFQDLDFRDTAFTFLAPHGEKGEVLKGLNYSLGVLLVGAVITLNVALGGMKGITLVQAFQYWAKMFAISVPIFVLMAVYGHYGKQVGFQRLPLVEPEYSTKVSSGSLKGSVAVNGFVFISSTEENRTAGFAPPRDYQFTYTLRHPNGLIVAGGTNYMLPGRYFKHLSVEAATVFLSQAIQEAVWIQTNIDLHAELGAFAVQEGDRRSDAEKLETFLVSKGFHLQRHPTFGLRLALEPLSNVAMSSQNTTNDLRRPIPAKAPHDYQWLNPFGPLTTKAAKNAAAAIGKKAAEQSGTRGARPSNDSIPLRADITPDQHLTVALDSPTVAQALAVYAELTGRKLVPNTNSVAERADDLLGGKLSQLKLITRGATPDSGVRFHNDGAFTAGEVKTAIENLLAEQGWRLQPEGKTGFSLKKQVTLTMDGGQRLPASISGGMAKPSGTTARLSDGTARLNGDTAGLNGDTARLNGDTARLNGDTAGLNGGTAGLNDGTARLNDGTAEPSGGTAQASRQTAEAGAAAEKAWLATHEKPLALLYTYSLIIAIVCGTAGLPHILVRFYTNPDGAAAKRTTMWVMILIGVFYLFPPVFGALGRNLLPDLYNGVGAKGTDKIVLELPRILNAKYPPLGSILSGITCAGAFAAFMSTFSGLLVSMTGALAHDVYGRILRPKSTPEQRMRMFKIGAVLFGAVAIVLGSFVEKLEINFMVGQAFAIAASSYFPLLFMAVWWRKLTMRGAAVGMLGGGLLAMIAISLTSFSTLAAGTDKTATMFGMFKPLNPFWAEHPLARILCEQPAIWAVPLAITLMIVVSKLTAKTIPSDIRMKMLVLHAPEQLGLKQEYIQEHQPGH